MNTATHYCPVCTNEEGTADAPGCDCCVVCRVTAPECSCACGTLSTFVEATETLAARMNDANRVEVCWFLRGYSDALRAALVELSGTAGTHPERIYAEGRSEAGMYRSDWLRGWSAGCTFGGAL